MKIKTLNKINNNFLNFELKKINHINTCSSSVLFLPLFIIKYLFQYYIIIYFNITLYQYILLSDQLNFKCIFQFIIYQCINFFIFF